MQLFALSCLRLSFIPLPSVSIVWMASICLHTLQPANPRSAYCVSLRGLPHMPCKYYIIIYFFCCFLGEFMIRSAETSSVSSERLTLTLACSIRLVRGWPSPHHTPTAHLLSISYGRSYWRRICMYILCIYVCMCSLTYKYNTALHNNKKKCQYNYSLTSK